jgi:mannitol-1-phosphate 5-dehydrogenase
MKSILIIGAGAVGRGFVAPLFATRRVAVDFLDTDPELVGRLSRRNSYLTAVANTQGHELTQVVYRHMFSPPEVVEAGLYDAVFVCTGVRQFLTCADLVRDARATYVLENLRSAPVQLRALAGHDRIWFGIPDVIVSCTAPLELLARDPLCVVAESGDLVLERDARPMESSAGLIWADPSELERRWACKLFIHNAAHAVAAFLGMLAGHDFVHQAMADDRICTVVERAIRTLTCAIIVRRLADRASATAYMERELRRFRNAFLHDPIRRVARDPLRKLGADDRLMQGLRLVLAARQDSGPMITGIAAGLLCHAREAGRPSTSAADLETLLRHDCALLNEGLIRVIVDRAQRLQDQYRSWPHQSSDHDLNQDQERAPISVRNLVA